MPLTTPVVVFILATPELLLLHVPPLTEWSNVVVALWQIVVVPVIDGTAVFTVTCTISLHPPGIV